MCACVYEAAAKTLATELMTLKTQLHAANKEITKLRTELGQKEGMLNRRINVLLDELVQAKGDLAFIKEARP